MPLAVVGAASGSRHRTAACDKLSIRFPESMFIDTLVLVASALLAIPGVEA
jgi:hypothetical protein